jgi:release factor glutamine methyltransferase
LLVARGNAERHRVAERITFILSNTYDGLDGAECFDVIVSNPPYIRTDAIAGLAPEVRDHEPLSALDGGPDGLGVFDRLLAGAAARLAPGGWLLVEVGFDQSGDAVRRITATPGLILGPTVQDGDGQPRVVSARRAEGP